MLFEWVKLPSNDYESVWLCAGLVAVHHLSKLPFSLEELISIVWKSLVVLGELESPPGGWQPFCYLIVTSLVGED